MGRVLFAVLVLGSGLVAEDDAEEARPFPHLRSINLNTGGTFFVEGRVKIPQGVTIQCKKDVRIVGRGGAAVLEVEGALHIKGMIGREVVFENVAIEPASTFEEIRLWDAQLHGAGVRCPSGQSARGRVMIENSEFHSGAVLDLTLRDSEVTILGAMFRDPVTIRGVPVPGGDRSSLKLDVQGCYFKDRGSNTPTHGYSGFLGGLFVRGAYRAVVRNNRIGGSAAEFVDCDMLTFDGNKVDCGELAFRQSRAGRFRRTRILKCDFLTSRLRFDAPRAARGERITLDKCWFGGRASQKEILEEVILDGRRDTESGVKVYFRKINERPLQLAGKTGN